MSTVHIRAEKNDIAETVLMPGDPLRAKYLADNYLENVTEFNGVRNILGFTGDYKGQRVSVMASGMGVPSISIYATELIQDFGVKNIVRIGSCGALQDNLELGSIVIATGASTDSCVNRKRLLGYDFAAIADFSLARAVAETAEKNKVKYSAGNVFTADLFYTPDFSEFDTLKKMGILGVEMEAAGLYGLAAEFGAKAVSILTVSDLIYDLSQNMSSEEREQSLGAMLKLALDSVSSF